ncbi:MAG: preprotein translocase subunit SecG [Bacteroidetes bacterium]|nr:preprotein translocase subunit SecG [Bacteroidota bacterium]
MTVLFVILIIAACVFLGFIILVQNRKGGGLAGSVGGFSNQLMGVKQTTDVLEKGTWVLAIVVALLCVFSAVFVPKATAVQGRDVKVNATSTVPAPSTTVPQQSVPATTPSK